MKLDNKQPGASRNGYTESAPNYKSFERIIISVCEVVDTMCHQNYANEYKSVLASRVDALHDKQRQRFLSEIEPEYASGNNSIINAIRARYQLEPGISKSPTLELIASNDEVQPSSREKPVLTLAYSREIK
jgi:hypothetical protein